MDMYVVIPRGGRRCRLLLREVPRLSTRCRVNRRSDRVPRDARISDEGEAPRRLLADSLDPAN